jgi:heavy metal sensor kinase
LTTKSIKFRLAGWYSVVFACGLAVFTVGAWFAMRASLYHAIDDELFDRVRGVESFMNKQISALSVPEIRDEFREHSVLGPGGDLFQVCDAQGQWLYRSVPLENLNVLIRDPGTLRAALLENRNLNGHVFRFYSEAIAVNEKPYTVQVASPMDEGLEALQRFRLLLILAAPVLLLAATAGGYFLSNRALAPVDAISKAAQRINIENMTDRLEVPRTGDQLQRLSETLNATFSRLEASVRRIKQFTADASHELRTPVSLIRTTAEIAVQRDRPASEYREALNDILQEAERTSQVVDSLMLLARADSAKEMLDLDVVDARVIVKSAAEQGAKLARNKGLKFEFTTPAEAIHIDADADALRRVFLILIDNAVKYTPESGTILVRIGVSGGFAVTSVSDTGMGISEDDLLRIFDRFWRADKVRSRAGGGAGLGLSIARWIVDQHRGFLGAESELGHGSVFRVSIPVVGSEFSGKQKTAN